MDEMKSTQGVMIHVEDDVNRFIGKDKESSILKKYKETYDTIASNVEKMARIEELVLQQRCILDTNHKPKIKLSILRDYVYARCPFYRRDLSTKDIRVIVSRLDLIYPDIPSPVLDRLYLDDDFMSKAKIKLIMTMKEKFLESCDKYNNEYD